MHEVLSKFATRISNALGHPYAFITALLFVIIWATTGPFLGFSQTWQMVVNTITTIITFLIGFIIQNTQNRDTKAVHIKLDALIEKSDASNSMIDIEKLNDKQLKQLEHQFSIKRQAGITSTDEDV